MLTVAVLKAHRGIDPKDTFDDARLQLAVDAALAWINRVRPDRDWRNPSADELQGLIYLASDFFERHGANTAGENAGYEFSGPIPVSNPDIPRLLGIGRYFGPVVA